jgi:hypothetical protein
MVPEPIAAQSRALLDSLRDLMLEQHKLLLDRERGRYEAIHGPIAGPGPFLNLVLEHPQFAWLRQISTLIVEIDEALSRRSTAGQSEADALVEQVRELMAPQAEGSDFHKRYYEAVQESPEIVILQVRIERLLGK